MNIAHKPTKLLVTGKSGSGKSTYWLKFIRNSGYAKYFIYDHELEFHLRTGIPAVQSITEEAIRENQFLVYDPAREWPGSAPDGFNYFSELVYRVCQQFPGKKLFACDELQKLLGTDTVSPEFSTLIETGRREEIDTAFVSQQPNLIHNRIRNQLTEVVTFAQVDRRAIQFLEDVGYQETEVRGLQELEFISLDLMTMSQRKGQIQFDKGATVVTSEDKQGEPEDQEQETLASSDEPPEHEETENV